MRGPLFARDSCDFHRFLVRGGLTRHNPKLMSDPLVKELLSRPDVRERMDRSFSHHRSTPDITFLDHFRTKKKLLYEWLKTKKKVYLDTCYWIDILNANEGSQKSPSIFYEIAELLEELRNRDVIICPSSFALVAEVLKQRDPASLKRTAELIDKLSCGVCLQNPPKAAEFGLAT
jgi:hypothetical protein